MRLLLPAFLRTLSALRFSSSTFNTSFLPSFVFLPQLFCGPLPQTFKTSLFLFAFLFFSFFFSANTFFLILICEALPAFAVFLLSAFCRASLPFAFFFSFLFCSSSKQFRGSLCRLGSGTYIRLRERESEWLRLWYSSGCRLVSTRWHQQLAQSFGSGLKRPYLRGLSGPIADILGGNGTCSSPLVAHNIKLHGSS